MNVEAATAGTLALCDRIGAHTDTPGAITRLFLSPATRAVHQVLREEMEALGMRVRTDAAGNLRGTLAARNSSPATPTLLIGSHIDTVPNAGRYDGILGVALPLALLANMEAEQLAYHVELIAFSEEEGVRFRTPFLGSRALIGDPANPAIVDANGISIADALSDFSVDMREPTGLTRDTFAFLEVHIEQGPVLESLAAPLGIVTAIAGQTRLAIAFTGQANHAGTTPMPLRRDALAAAAVFITAVENLALATEGLVATVGVLEARPGAPNIIPGEATLSLDVRHADDCTRLRARMALTAEARRISLARGLTVRIRQTSQQGSVPMDAALIEALGRAALGSGYTPHRMASGAGHDSMILAPHVPTAMLFLRTPGGLSHHPDEAVLAEDVAAGLATLHRLLTVELPQTEACAEDAK